MPATPATERTCLLEPGGQTSAFQTGRADVHRGFIYGVTGRPLRQKAHSGLAPWAYADTCHGLRASLPSLPRLFIAEFIAESLPSVAPEVIS